jgi:hypothetical protein
VSRRLIVRLVSFAQSPWCESEDERALLNECAKAWSADLARIEDLEHERDSWHRRALQGGG